MALDCAIGFMGSRGEVLERMAQGHSYEQIFVQELAWTYHDIFHAAAEALHLLVPGRRLCRHPRRVVFPTRVGMVRNNETPDVVSYVFPTRVGMVRCARRIASLTTQSDPARQGRTWVCP